MTLLLGTNVFGTASASGNAMGYWFGYVIGGLFRRFAMYFYIPVWLVALYLSFKVPRFRIKINWNSFIPLLVFILYAIAQLWLANPIFAYASIERFINTLLIVIIALPLCFCEGCRLYWIGLIVSGFLFVMSLLFSGQLQSVISGGGFIGIYNDQGRLALNTDTITSASIMYQCALATIFWIIANPKKENIISVLFIFVLLGIAILTGSKGPAIGFVLSLIPIGFYRNIKNKGFFFVVLFVFVALLWNSQAILGDYSNAANHLAVDINEELRIYFYNSVIESVPTLIGNGIGSWGVTFAGGSEKYVHNSILEVYYEMGLVGACLFLWALGNIGIRLFKVLRSESNPVVGFLLAYFVYGVVTSMFSGSIFGDTVLWVGLVLSCTQLNHSPTNIYES